jgi:hypothetical protein
VVDQVQGVESFECLIRFRVMEMRVYSILGDDQELIRYESRC